MIPAPAGPPCPEWGAARDRDPVAQRSRAFFALLDWGAVPARDPRRPWPGPPPHPRATPPSPRARAAASTARRASA